MTPAKQKVKQKSNNLEPGSRVPEVIIDFEYEEDSLFIVIANVGSSSAHRISIQCDKEIRDFRDSPITEMEIFRGLEFMPPGKKIRFFVDKFSTYLKTRRPLKLQFKITYFDQDSRRKTDIIRHNLAIFKGIITSYQDQEEYHQD